MSKDDAKRAFVKLIREDYKLKKKEKNPDEDEDIFLTEEEYLMQKHVTYNSRERK